MGPGLHAHVPRCTAMHPPSPALHPLHFDIFRVTLDFIHRCHELEANAVALIYREDLCEESRGERGWAGHGASPDGGTGVTLTFSTVCAVCTGASPSRASTVTWYCPFSEPSRLLATLQGWGHQRPHGTSPKLQPATVPRAGPQDGFVPLPACAGPACTSALRQTGAEPHSPHPGPDPWPHWMLPT